jgi:glycosyltransferase involved in cell wall biosynthesis
VPNDVFTLFHNAANPGAKRLAAVIDRQVKDHVPLPEWHVSDGAGFWSAINHFLLPFRFVAWMHRARRELSSHGPFDALIADNGSYPGAWTCLAALWASHQLGIPKRMMLVHHSASTYGVARRFFEQIVDHGVQSWATDLVAVSRATRDSLIHLRFFNTERNPIRVIHNGIRMPADCAPDPAMREGWGAGPKDFIIGMLGRIERYKGHEDLLLAMAEVPSDISERLRLVVVGSGPTEERLRLQHIAERLCLADRLHFTGYMSQDPMVLVRQFDLLAMVTKDFEGFGLAVAEAMAAGTPIVATNVGAIPEYVSTDVALLVPPESPTDIARAIEAVYRDSAAAGARAQRAKAHVASFSDEIMSRKFQRLLSL